MDYTQLELLHKATCNIMKADYEKTFNNDRSRLILEPRQTTMYLASDGGLIKPVLTLQEIGIFFDYKDHATVLNAKKTIKNLYETDGLYKNKMKCRLVIDSIKALYNDLLTKNLYDIINLKEKLHLLIDIISLIERIDPNIRRKLQKTNINNNPKALYKKYLHSNIKKSIDSVLKSSLTDYKKAFIISKLFKEFKTWHHLTIIPDNLFNLIWSFLTKDSAIELDELRNNEYFKVIC